MDIIHSKAKGKRFKAVFVDGRPSINFGSKGANTFIDSGDRDRRKAYIARHRLNENWNAVNAGSLSKFLLWGDSTSLSANKKSYERRFNL